MAGTQRKRSFPYIWNSDSLDEQTPFVVPKGRQFELPFPAGKQIHQVDGVMIVFLDMHTETADL